MNEIQKKSKIRIEPYSVFRDIVKNLWVIVLAALIGYMSVSVWNDSTYTPMYTSTATMLVNVRNSAVYSYTNLSSSAEMARIFTEVFVQPTMKAYAADHLGMDHFVGSVSAKVLENTNIFTVSVTTSSPETSYRELCSILEIYPQISESVFSDAVIEVMRSPNLPAAPSNYISSRNQKLAVAGCAALVLLIIVYLSVMRDTVKDEQSFRENIDSKLFGVVGHENPHLNPKEILMRKKSSLLISDAYASFRFTENYHKLATKLEYLKRNQNAKIILVTSLAENEGKSTTAANIALALASRNNKVALFDMDFKKPALHKIFGLQGTDFMDLAFLLSEKVSLNEYQFCPYKQTGLDLALNKKSYNNYVEWVYTDRIAGVFNELRNSEQYDFIIVDTPPLSVAADVTGIVQLADISLLVVRTDYVYSAAVNDAVLSLSESNHFAGCILNDVHREFSMMGQMGFDENGYGSKYRYGKKSRYNDYYGYNSYSKYSDYKDAPPSEE